MTQAFVLDCSVAMAWCLKDEISPYADQVLDSLSSATALAPSLWWLEVCNILIIAERQRRIKERDRTRALHLLQQLPIEIDTAFSLSPDQLILICQEHQLTTYDGVYLYLALSKGLPIASLDKQLKKAAMKSGCGIYLDNSSLK